MKISPYLHFNGNCSEAIAFYEKALGGTAKIMRYGEVPPEEDFQVAEETKDFVMHAQMEINGEMLMFCDNSPDFHSKNGDDVAIMLEYDCVEDAKRSFAGLKEGGQVLMDIQETFWSACFGSVVDKYGKCWYVSIVD